MNTPLCALSQLTDGAAIEVQHGEDSLVLLRFDEQVRAYHNVCPHAGRPLNWAPGMFLFSHGQLVCPSHGASFRPEDGYCLGGPCRGESLTAVAVKVKDGQVVLA